MSNNFGVTDTTLTGVTAAKITVPTLNWEADFAVTANQPGNVKLINVTTGVDQEETMRFSYSNKANAYAGSNIPVEYQEPVKSGFSILAQTTETAKVSDSAGNFHYLPMSMHTVFTGLKSAYLTDTMYEELLARHIGMLYYQGSSNFKALLKGAIMPKGL